MKLYTTLLSSVLAISTITPVCAFAGGDCTDWGDYSQHYDEYGNCYDNYCIDEISDSTYYESEEAAYNEELTYSNDSDVYYADWGEGWQAVIENTGYSMQEILDCNGWDLGTEVQYGVPIYLPAVHHSDFPTIQLDVTDCTDFEDTEESYAVHEEVIAQRTLYNNPNADSWWNIRRAAEMLDGVEVENGEILSFYDQFPNQAGIEDGMIESNVFLSPTKVGRAVGAGVCFPSTLTWQTSTLDAGMISIERHDHVQPVGYAQVGVNDAAVNLSIDPLYRQDMRVLNNTGYTVRYNYYIDSSVGALTCVITKLSDTSTN